MNEKADSDKVPFPRLSLPPRPSVLVNGPSPDDTADYYNGLCRRGLGADAPTLTAAWLQAQIAAVAASQPMPLFGSQLSPDERYKWAREYVERWGKHSD